MNVVEGYRVPFLGARAPGRYRGAPRGVSNSWCPPGPSRGEREKTLLWLEASLELLHMTGESEIDPNAVQTVAIALPQRDRSRLLKAGSNIGGIIHEIFELLEVKR